MREILFRGKRYDKRKEWVVGNLYVERYRNVEGYGDFDKCAIGVAESGRPWQTAVYEVLTETVGQFTGLTDKNGTKIFEGDVIKYIAPDSLCSVGEIRFGEYGTGGTIGVGFFVEWHRPSEAEWLRQDIGFWSKCRDIEIIGNVYDNPELLGGTDNA